MRNTLIKALLSFLAASLLMVGLATGAYALESSVVLDGTGNLVTIPGDDLFSELKDLMPGAVGTQTININNKNSRTVDIYLKTAAADFLTEEQQAQSQALLENLTLTLVLKKPGGSTSTLYSGPATGPQSGKTISLGKYRKNQAGTITATLTVPSELDNEFQNAVGKTKWIFSCVQRDDSSSGSNDDDDDDIFTYAQRVTMPNTGGFPVEIAAVAGGALLLGGILLRKRK